MQSLIERAIQSLKEGRMVLIFDSDGREAETDLVIASQFVTPEVIKIMRKDGGGLICVTVHADIRRKLGLPYLTDVFYRVGESYPVMRKLIPNDIPYDEKSAFAVTINHRKTFTGISDWDRALTITRFAELAKSVQNNSDGWAQEEFGRQFRSPGHVHLLNASESLLAERRGHTELATTLLLMAGLIPTATICEMIGEDGRSLPREEAKKYAEERNLVFLEGEEIVEAWKNGQSHGFRCL